MNSIPIPVKELFERRKKELGVEDCRYFGTGKCLTCDKKADGYSTITVGTDTFSMTVFDSCETCREEAKEIGFAAYLAKKHNLPLPIQTMDMTDEERLSLVEKTLVEKLNCEIIKINDRKIEVTGIRPSGVEVKLKCTKPYSYSYMIFKDGEQIYRVDSARDHDVRLGPDHTHDLLNGNKVEGSVTYGMPMADYKHILSLIDKVENN